MQYNCQKSSNFQGLSHFSRIFGKMTKFQDFSRLEKLSPFFQVFQELWEPCITITLLNHYTRNAEKYKNLHRCLKFNVYKGLLSTWAG